MKIGVFYSYGPQLKNAIDYICNNNPEDEIIVFLPNGYPIEFLKNFEKIKIQFLPWDGSHLTCINALFVLPRILKVLRRANLDILVILFESPRLIFLSKLSKASKIHIFDVFSNYKQLGKKLFSTLVKTAWRIVKGYILYFYIKTYTKVFPVKNVIN